MSASQGPLGDHYFYTGRVKFNEKDFFAAQAAFARLLEGEDGMDLRLTRALHDLALAFEFIHGRRMLDPGYVHLTAAARALGEIPLTTHRDVDLSRVRDEVDQWVAHMERLGIEGGPRPRFPRFPKL